MAPHANYRTAMTLTAPGRRPRSEVARHGRQRPDVVATGVGIASSLVDIVICITSAAAISQLWQHNVTPVSRAIVPALISALLAAIRPLLVARVLRQRGRHLSEPTIAAVVDRALVGRSAIGDLVVRGSAVADFRREQLAIDARSGAVLSLPVAAAIVGALVTPWVLAIIGALLGAAVPFYIWSGRASARERARHLEREADTLTRWTRYLVALPTLRGIHRVDVGVRDLEAATDREHSSAQRAIARALGSSAVSEFVAGVAVGLVAMVLGFSLFRGHHSYPAGSGIFRSVLAVLLTAHIAAAWRQRGADFHAREEIAASIALLEPSAITSVTSGPLVARDVVTRAGRAPVSFDLPPGSHLHLAGPSGSGKTSLIRCLVGSEAPQSGSIAGQIGERVGLVSPDVALPPMSLRENLGSETIDVDALFTSVGLAHLLLDEASVIGQLSDGERVRVVLARALALHADALVIDDVVGLLDADTRELCRRAIATLAPTATVIEAGHGEWLTTADLVIEVNS